MSQFIAIPVAQGDAFYLERDDWSALVDGGRSRAGFHSLFKDATNTQGVNILVCTHNDADHANGILGFLEDGLSCDEVWLPGRWLEALPKVLRPYMEVLDELVGNIDEAEWPLKRMQPGISPIEAYADRLHGTLDNNHLGNNELSKGKNGWPESCIQMFEQAEDWEFAPMLCSLHHNDCKGYWRSLFLEQNKLKLLWSAIEAASRIRAIATQAFHRSIPVRWFEFDPLNPYGGIDNFQPINAREIANVRPRVARLLDFLALTVSNKESLVFWSPPQDQHDGVLFTADSDLAGVKLPSLIHGAIVTAPHHGSDANAGAYQMVASTAQHNSSPITWVRSDGRYQKRPGVNFLKLPSQRFCTLCRQANKTFTKKCAVHLFSQTGVWVSKNTSACSCQ